MISKLELIDHDIIFVQQMCPKHTLSAGNVDVNAPVYNIYIIVFDNHLYWRITY